jgi:tryptophanase
MNYVAAVAANVFERRNDIKRGLEIAWEAPIMRHFTVKLNRI